VTLSVPVRPFLGFLARLLTTALLVLPASAGPATSSDSPNVRPTRNYDLPPTATSRSAERRAAALHTSGAALDVPGIRTSALAPALAAKAGDRVPWVVGKLPGDEEDAVLATLGHIDTGTKPAGALAKKWGSQFKNYAADLPGPKGAGSPYREYRVAPPPGVSGAGTRRVVVDSRTGAVFYSWTHYGDTGRPAFVRIR
jgi:hypothetical protein